MRRQPHNELALSSPAVRGRFAADVSDAEEGLLRFPIDSASCESVAWVPAEIADMFFQCCLVVSSVRLSAQIILSMFVFMLNGEVPTFYTIQHAHNPRQRNRARLFSIWRRRWCPLVRQWVLSEVCKFTMWFIISSTPTGLDISFPRLILSTQLGKPSLQFLPNDEPTMCDINILEDAISIVEGNYPWPGLHFHFDRFLQRSLITSRCVFVFRPQESLIPILQLRTGRLWISPSERRRLLMWTWLDTRKGFQHQPTALRKMASIYMGCQTNEPCSQIHQCETQVHRETPKKIKLGFFKLHPTPTVTGELAPFIWTKGSGCSKPSNHSNIGLRVFYVKIT